jgi:hypothetical protein
MLAKLDDGAGRKCLFLPFIGEFGHLIMTHIRQVHFHRAGRKIVCCRPGEEVLFPSADAFDTDWHDPIDDSVRCGTANDHLPVWNYIERRYPYHRRIVAGRLTPEQELYAIQPKLRIPFRPTLRGLQADVVLGIRHRRFCPERNWKHWQFIVDRITAAGFTFAVIGAKPTSLELEGQVCHSGDFDTDAAIELMQKAALYVGTDTGVSHLASTVGVPMLVFRETASQSRNLLPRMAEVNPGNVETIDDGWVNPSRVADRIIERLQMASHAVEPAGR